MRIFAKRSVATVVTTLGLVVFACGGNQDAAQQPTTPQGQQQPQAYPQQPYPQQQPQAYPQQPQQQNPPPPQQQQTFPQQQQQQPTPQPQASPTPVAPAASGAMATPGPFALPCQNDGACGLARCNTQFQKCAFPCRSAADCNATASCNPMTGLCLPGGH